ncbi:MAG: oligosaccharide flippase family protein [Clostridiales bacterium]|nr:oligosaccharide flippase family protein [Clostridiales bacterium]
MNNIMSKVKTLLKTGFFHIFGASAINKVLAFLCNIVLLHIISKPEYGVFTYAWNIYSIVILFSGMGITSGILQLCSEHAGDEEYQKRATDYGTRFGLRVNLLLFAILLGIGLFAPLKIEKSRMILIATCLMPFVQLYFELININLRVKKLNSRFAKMQLSNTVIFYAVSLSSAFILREMGLVVGHYVSWIASIIIGVFVFKVSLLSSKRESIGSDKGALLKISLISMTNNSLSHLLYLLDVFVLGIVDPQETILASYKAATLIPTALTFIPASLMTYIYPYFAQHRLDKKWCRKYYRMTVLGFGAFNMLVSGVLVILAPFIVKYTYGAQYLDCVPVFRILSVNYFIAATFRTLSSNLLVTQRALKFNLFVAIVSSVVNLIADYFFIQWWGSVGAAFATVLVVLVSSILSTTYLIILLNKKDDKSKETEVRS